MRHLDADGPPGANATADGGRRMTGRLAIPVSVDAPNEVSGGGWSAGQRRACGAVVGGRLRELWQIPNERRAGQRRDDSAGGKVGTRRRGEDDDVIAVGVVVVSRDPRWVGRAPVRERRERDCERAENEEERDASARPAETRANHARQRPSEVMEPATGQMQEERTAYDGKPLHERAKHRHGKRDLAHCRQETPTPRGIFTEGRTAGFRRGGRHRRPDAMLPAAGPGLARRASLSNLAEITSHRRTA